MNSLIYTEESRLIIEKPNGLRYEFENVDKPELGFEFDVVVSFGFAFRLVLGDMHRCG